MQKATNRFRPAQLRTTAAFAISMLLFSVPTSIGFPAAAEATATVKARTQKMSDSTLNSHQNGWYNVGERLTLVCSKRGQPVKGFFSFNIPGGWDNLWYRTTDGSYVADVDIETGTLNAVAPDCSAPPPVANPAPAQSSPPPASARVDAALAKANSMVGTNAFGDVGCGRFVAAAYGVPGIGYHTAKQFRDALASQGKIHMNGSAPKGALVFSQSSWDQGAGHVVIAQGDGTFVSGGMSRTYRGLQGAYHNVQVLSHWNPARGAVYLGWAVAPW